MIFRATLMLFFLSLQVGAQGEYLNGRLVDAVTKEPVPFATIAIKGRAVGVITNKDGGFKVPEKFRKIGDTLEISSMGYQTRQLLLSSLTPDEINDIPISPRVLQLQEAILEARKKNPLTAREIVQRAIEVIPDNFPMTPFSTIGYYRDYQLKNDAYINLNEAIFEVFDQGFKALNFETTKVSIYEYRANEDFDRDTLALVPYDYVGYGKVINNAFLSGYGGNEFTILQIHDAIRNYKVPSYNFVNRFDTDLLKNHSFEKTPDTYFDDQPLYTIQFQKVHPGYSAYGTLYVSKTNFAIYKLDYALYDRRSLLPDRGVNNRGSRYPLIFEIHNSYRQEANKMYLNYISFHNSFKVRIPPFFRVNAVIVDTDKNCFSVAFNHPPANAGVFDLSNYKLFFKKKRIPLVRAERLNEEVSLWPAGDPQEIASMLEEIIRENSDGKVPTDIFKYEVRNISDNQGNLINEWTSSKYDQFREFFAQKIKPRQALPPDRLFMDKTRPIFNEQPILSPMNSGDYWMNTPLPETPR